MPEGYYVNQGAGGVTPKNIRREQKVTFWMRLNSEKLKNLRKTKKTRPESGVVGEGSPLGEGWSDGVDQSDLIDRNRAGCNGTVADM